MLGLRSVKPEELVEPLHVCLAEDKGDMTTLAFKGANSGNRMLQPRCWSSSSLIYREEAHE